MSSAGSGPRALGFVHDEIACDGVHYAYACVVRACVVAGVVMETKT